MEKETERERDFIQFLHTSAIFLALLSVCKSSAGEPSGSRRERKQAVSAYFQYTHLPLAELTLPRPSVDEFEGTRRRY